MATFPTWIKKNNADSKAMSPRQIANKAYSLAIKKLDKDEKRRRPQYSIREKLLLSNTMAKAESVLNKQLPRSNRRVLAFEQDDDVLAPPLKKLASMKKQETVNIKQETTVHNQTKNESLPIPEQIILSIAVIATALQQQQQQQQHSLLCRPFIIPSNLTNSLTPII
ncbi:uncharacterized protein B0P05DRAFT_542025 [Gilbertella persicaria]|uniref:uncharacterized protein n=1 Tax=Gilbertella persicaria TaxID=101096 RepID=UPI0022205DEC|nr:uncharacterized protein B0P05DRAFT_542025 [Gilbertella persicaria]KAI8079007.1 hypothetical protein B0P05DRAFT_542025 [Gilbertella persicaria]